MSLLHRVVVGLVVGGSLVAFAEPAGAQFLCCREETTPRCQELELAADCLLVVPQGDIVESCDECPEPAPTLSHWGLIVFALLLLASSLLVVWHGQPRVSAERPAPD